MSPDTHNNNENKTRDGKRLACHGSRDDCCTLNFLGRVIDLCFKIMII